jgi:hypothetical protein
MSIYTMSRNSTYVFIFALVLGVILAVGASVWATSVGTNVTVTGTLAVQSSTASSSVTQAFGVGTTTPAMQLSVGGAAGTATGHGYFTGGLGIGAATTTAGNLQMTGDIQAAVLSLSGLANVGTVNVTGNGATTTSLAVTSHASTSALRVSNLSTLGTVSVTGTGATTTNISVTNTASTSELVVGGSGTVVTQLLHGYVDCGPIVASDAIAATSTGIVTCTTGLTQLSAGDKIWLTASTTAAADTGLYVYTGIASTTAANHVQAEIYNVSGASYTVTTSSWQYFSIK